MEPKRSQQPKRFVRLMVGDKLEDLEVENGFYVGFVDHAPRPEELLRAATAPPCGTREDGAEPESSSSSSAGEDVGERTDTYDQAVRAPNPARKLSEDEFVGLGQLAASAGPLSPLGGIGEQPLSGAAELGRSKVLPQVPQPQTLSLSGPDSSGSYQVIWTVDARKLKSNDKQAVSPPFDLRFNEAYPKVTFKLMIYPKAEQPKTEHASRKSEETVSRGAACFKKSGSGTIQLKCENDLSNSKTSVSFQLAVGNTEMRLPMRPTEAINHTFSQSAMAGLPKEAGLDIWNLNEVVDSKSTTFYVYATIRTHSDVDDSVPPL